MSYRILLILILSLSSCAVGSISYEGSLTQKGNAIKASIEGTTGANFNLYLNDELVGEMKYLKSDGMKSQTYEPLETKFGIVRMVNNIKWTLTDTKYSYDFYINDVYVGRIIKEFGGLGQGPK